MFKLIFDDGRPAMAAEDREEAISACRARWPEAVVGEEDAEGRTLVWASAEHAGPDGLGDDGGQAAAEIRPTC